jgi:hypothetical protein
MSETCLASVVQSQPNQSEEFAFSLALREEFDVDGNEFNLKPRLRITSCISPDILRLMKQHIAPCVLKSSAKDKQRITWPEPI